MAETVPEVWKSGEYVRLQGENVLCEVAQSPRCLFGRKKWGGGAGGEGGIGILVSPLPGPAHP